MTDHVDYRTHSRWTDPGRFAPLLAAVAADPDAVVAAVPGLLYHPWLAAARGVAVPPDAVDDRTTRALEPLVARLLARDDAPLAAPRAPAARGFCVCAGFARLAAAIFRARGVPARCRVGFAAYFSPALEDRWVAEYHDGAAWKRLDAQLGAHTLRPSTLAFDPADVPRERFLDASTAWRRMRAGELDPGTMGLSALGLTGAERAELRGRAAGRRGAWRLTGATSRRRAAGPARPTRPT